MNVYQQNTHAHSVGWSTWHFEWCTKYRYRMLGREDIKNFCLIAIREAAKRHRMEIVDLEVDVDHVHVIVSIPLTMAPSRALHLLKGLTSKLMFQLVPNFRKRYRKGHLWSPGKFMASVGHITVEKAKQYLEEHHAKASTFLSAESPPAKRSGAGCPKGNPLQAVL